MAGVTIQEAARVLGVSVDTVRRRIKRGEIDARQDANGRYLVTLPDSAPTQRVNDTYAVPTQEAVTPTHAYADVERDLAHAHALLEEVRRQRDYLEEQVRAKDTQLEQAATERAEMRRLLGNAQMLLGAGSVEASKLSNRIAEDESPTRGTNVAPDGVPQAVGASQAVPDRPQRWPWWMRILAGK